jgi:hypothetical protein
MPVLVPDRARLNPRFEAYRLSSAPDDLDLRTTLDVPVIPAAGHGHAPIALAQARARAARNHLAVSPSGQRALFIDAERRVLVVSLDVCNLI